MIPDRKQIVLELAGSNWRLNGMTPDWMGRLRHAIIPDSACTSDKSIAGVVNWQWAAGPQGWEAAGTLDEFDMSFEYRERDFQVLGKRFLARIRLGTTLEAEVTLLRSGQDFAEGIIENIMRILVAYRTLGQGGMLLHSACFTDGQRAWLIFGHSGAGKSTCSAFASDAGLQVLSDDLNVLFHGPGGWSVRRVPFSGSCQKQYSGPASLPVTSICHLRQADTNRLEKLSPATGAALVIASSAFVNEDPWRSALLLKNSEQLLQNVPVQALYFRRTPEFLNLLTHQDESQAVA